jgi:hypothetical protein
LVSAACLVLLGLAFGIWANVQCICVSKDSDKSSELLESVWLDTFGELSSKQLGRGDPSLMSNAGDLDREESRRSRSQRKKDRDTDSGTSFSSN